MGYLLNGVESGGLPVGIVKALLSAAPIPYFVETGTAGGTSVWAATFLFDKCYTIEIKEDAYNDNKKDHGNSKITHYLGDSVKVLPEIIKELDGSNALFFLDAHYSDAEPSDGTIKECPVIDEIRTLSSYQKSIIIIDDARLFMGPPPYPLDPRQWPSLWQIFYELNAAFVWHSIMLRDDYIICAPLEFQQALDKEWSDRFYIRYPNAEEKLRTEMRNSYKEMEKRFEYFKKWINV